MLLCYNSTTPYYHPLPLSIITHYHNYHPIPPTPYYHSLLLSITTTTTPYYHSLLPPLPTLPPLPLSTHYNHQRSPVSFKRRQSQLATPHTHTHTPTHTYPHTHLYRPTHTSTYTHTHSLTHTHKDVHGSTAQPHQNTQIPPYVCKQRSSTRSH